MDLLSVIIPAYNAENYIKESVDSAITQTYKNIEIIVVNDGSTDSTPNILNQYGKKIRVIHQSNRGRSAANNTGILKANGEWIAFLDADDTWLENKVSNQMEACRNYSISHSDSICVGEKLEKEIIRSTISPLHSGKVLKKLLVENFITKSTVMVKREVLQKYGGFDESYECVIDWPLWLKICYDNELGYLSKALVRYRVHPESVSMKCRRTLPAHLRVIEEAFRKGGVGEKFPELKKAAKISSYSINCHYAAESGDWRFAVYCGMKSLLHGKRDVRVLKNIIKALLIPMGVKY